MLSTQEFNEKFLEKNKQAYSTTEICELLGEKRDRGIFSFKKNGTT